MDKEKRSGLFVLTGSQQFGLLSGISQTLAGRAGLVHLLPFTASELGARAPDDLETLLWQGLYPPVQGRGVPPHLWYADYMSTYIERGETLYPVEFKAGRTVAADWFDTLGHFLGWAGGKEGALIYGGKAAQSRSSIEVRGWRAIEEAAELAFGRTNARHRLPR